jgi:hypothetical protein
MDDLTAFLCARLDEDEEIAWWAALTMGDTGYEQGELVRPPSQYGDALAADGQYRTTRYHQVVRYKSRGPRRMVAEAAACGVHEAEHIARHDPARVLREAGAKRQEIQLHQSGQHPGLCGYDGHELPCPSLRNLASVWSDHSCYQQEWAL